MVDKECHDKPVEDVVAGLKSHIEKGLTQAEAEARLKQYGYNELQEKPRPGFFQLLLDQFNNFLVIILIIAAVVSLLLGEYVDAIVIMVIVVLNAVVGVVQESKAEAALAALKKMSAPNAQVIRDGHQVTIPSRELVAGDIVILEAGNYIPADMRLIECVNLKIEEASLTGESVPVEKDHNMVLDKDAPLGDRRNTAFMSTVVTYGRGKGLVTGTGMHTQIGLIAEMLQSFEDEDTPLQQKLEHLGKVLGTACLAVCGIVFVYGLFRDTHIMSVIDTGILHYLSTEKMDIINLFMTAVALAIAAVPEGLPAIVTICLALGMQQMIKRHALIRKLPAVETLGCATVICSDKTGTLTQNEMTVVQAWAGGKRFRITGEGYSPNGQFLMGEAPFDPTKDADAAVLLQGSLLCNDAILEEMGESKGERLWRIIGDPTEGAMVVAATKSGFQKDETAKLFPRVQEIPFDSERKRMTTIHSNKKAGSYSVAGFTYPETTAFVKGAPDLVLDLCTHILEDGQSVPLSDAMRRVVLDQNHDLASNALRVLAVAYRSLDGVPVKCDIEAVERDLTFVGLMGMIDPARPEVVEAIKVAKKAGLRSVMVTGDYKDTAQAIAREIGLLSPDGLVLTGQELDKMTEKELAAKSDKLQVCCRVSPTHKTMIVDALKDRGHIVAMTGDGVNDAPALKRANIGVAMGITGTDVTKETADMVLTDDNFASIVSAIEQGRIIYSNIRKFVYFLLACNIGEILIIFGSMLVGLPIPMRPIQLLWLNLVSDGAPALALGMEKGDPDTMNHPPRPPKEPVINKDMAIGLAVVSIVDAIAIIGAFYFVGLDRYPDSLSHAQTIAFVTLCTSELIRAYTARSEYHSLFSIGVFSNKWMNWAVGASFLLVLAVVYLPFMQPLFGTESITFADWLEMSPFFFASPIAMELVKVYLRLRKAKSPLTAAAS